MSSLPNSSSSSEINAPEFRPFHDVSCNIDIVLGTGTMTVRECIQLRRHMVIRLAQSAGADLNVMVNGVSIAMGEVVIVDDSTAIRITDIAPPPSADVNS
jgi:flagellar motor switch protein FliN/FliY